MLLCLLEVSLHSRLPGIVPKVESALYSSGNISIEYRLVWLKLRRNAFTCVRCQVTLRDPIWQMTLRIALRWVTIRSNRLQLGLVERNFWGLRKGGAMPLSVGLLVISNKYFRTKFGPMQLNCMGSRDQVTWVQHARTPIDQLSLAALIISPYLYLSLPHSFTKSRFLPARSVSHKLGLPWVVRSSVGGLGYLPAWLGISAAVICRPSPGSVNETFQFSY